MKRYFSFEIYKIAKTLGFPVHRSVLTWFKSSGAFRPIGMQFRYSIYSQKDVIAMIKRVAARRKVEITDEQITETLKSFGR